jgi:hypothetical protein
MCGEERLAQGCWGEFARAGVLGKSNRLVAMNADVCIRGFLRFSTLVFWRMNEVEETGHSSKTHSKEVRLSLLGSRASKGVAAFIVVIGFAGLFFFEKCLVGTAVRLTAPLMQSQDAAEGGNSEYLVDFDRLEEASNILRGSDAGLAFQVDSPHVLKILNLVDHPVSVHSFGTFVDFRKGRYGWLTFQAAREAVSYSQALESIREYAKVLGIEDQLDFSEYERHLGPVSEAETWIPKLQFAGVEVSPMLNCNWEWFVNASEQLNKVRCRPNFMFSRVE